MPDDTRDEAPNIFPVLRYRDAPGALRWLAAAFGFATTMEVPGPGGLIAHAEMSFGAGVIMLGSTKDEQGVESPRDPGAARHGIYVYVDDVDAHYERARAAGAEIVRELDDREYGAREYSARDPEGYHWSFGTYRPSSGA
ncbi:MAG: VOC family protein [Actinomycetota bacterium]|nr:VOC family protein [Actinomycetota bacterium]